VQKVFGTPALTIPDVQQFEFQSVIWKTASNAKLAGYSNKPVCFPFQWSRPPSCKNLNAF
jgi:hypothetical protein